MSATDPAPSDEALLEAARAGDQGALSALLQRHQARIYAYGLRMCRDPEDAKDVLQETMLAMARGVRDFRGSSSLSTWLYTIARSHCIKKRRRSKFAPDGADVAPGDAREISVLRDPAAWPDDVVDRKEIGTALEAAIAALEPTSREVLILRDVEGLSAAEVAQVVGLSVQAVKSRLHRARVAVRDDIAPLLGVPTDPPAATGTCPDVLQMFSRHLEDEIRAEDCSTMERHLEVCPRCKRACDSLRRTLALCRTAAGSQDLPPAIQSAVQLALRQFLRDAP